MKYFIASDIHGSAFWCEKMLDAFSREDADRLLLLGDLLYHGPRNDLPKEYNCKKTAAMLNGVKNHILCVRGNCEAEVDQMMLEFPVLADYAVIPFGKNIIFATHGHHFNEQTLPPLCHGDILLHGHTHVSMLSQHESYTYINPGSVSIPKENTPHSYIIFDGTSFIWKDLTTGEAYRIWQK